MKNISRTHDKEIYLKENRHEQPKEIFKKLSSMTQRSEVLKPGSVLVDFGCAAGEFLYHLSQTFLQVNLYGYDVIPELLTKGRTMVPSATFRNGSVLDRDLLPAQNLDVAYMLGVHSIFNDFAPCFSNLIHWTKPGGRIFVFGLFNPYPADVWVHYRMVDDPDRSHLEPGWNIFAKESVSKFLDNKIGSGKHSFTSFEMPFDLNHDPIDPIRSWTFTDAAGQRILTNGLSLLCNLEILEIRP